MNRLYSVESDLTLTGGTADHRLRLASSKIESFAALFLCELLKSKNSTDKKLIDHLEALGSDVKAHRNWLTTCAQDMLSKAKNSAVIIGSHQSENAHLLTYAINHTLGNIGTCINYITTEASNTYTFSDLKNDIENAQVDSVVVIGGNPTLSVAILRSQSDFF